MVLGIALGVVGLFRLMKSGLALLMWLTLAILGGGVFFYGFKNSDTQALAGIQNAATAIISRIGPGTPAEIVHALCEKFDATGLEVASQVSEKPSTK